MSTEDEVRAASETFYAALNTMLGGDASSLADIWSHDPEVTAMHPIGDFRVGWDDVMGSFQEVAATSSGGHVAMTERMIRVHGEMAYEVGIEKADFAIQGTPLTVNSRVTNVYRLEEGTWKIVHHHGDKAMGIEEALEKAREG